MRCRQAVQPVPAPVPFIAHLMDWMVPEVIPERISVSETPRQWQMILSVEGDINTLARFRPFLSRVRSGRFFAQIQNALLRLSLSTQSL
jgi:hypothetical protein